MGGPRRRGLESGGARDPRAGPDGVCVFRTPDAPVCSGPWLWCLEDEDRVRLCSASVAGRQRTEPARAEARCPGQSRTPLPSPCGSGAGRHGFPTTCISPDGHQMSVMSLSKSACARQADSVLGHLLQVHLGSRRRAGWGCVRGRGTSGPQSWGWGAGGCVPHLRRPAGLLLPEARCQRVPELCCCRDSVGLRGAPGSAEEAAP